MTLTAELERIGRIAASHADAGEEVAAVLVAEPARRERLYLCAFVGTGGRRWLALDAHGAPVRSRDRLREAVSIAALCEVAEESAGIVDETTPRVASPAYLDKLGTGSSETALAIQAGFGAVDELARDVEMNYKLPLD